MKGRASDAGTVYLVRGSFRPASDAVSRSVLELAIAMRSVGRNVKIVSWTKPENFDMLLQLPDEALVTLGSGTAGTSYTSKDRFVFVLNAFRYLNRNVRRGDRVVTLEDPTALGLAAAPFKLKGVKHFIYLMDLQSIQHLALAHGGRKAALLNRIRRDLDRFVWRASDAVVVLGDCMQEVVRRIQPRAKVLVVPIWQDGSRIRPVDATATRTLLDIDDKFVVMYLGHATYRQPLNILLKAAEELGDDSNVLFMVVGNGPSVDWLKSSADALGLDNVRVTPRVEGADFLNVLSAADVHVAVLDERATGTCVPSKAYTSMAVAKPCLYVGSKDGQAASDLMSAQSGYVVGTSDTEAFVQHVRDLEVYVDDRQQMGKSGHSYFMRERELSVIAQRWLELLA